MTEVRDIFNGVTEDEANSNAETARRYFVNTGQRTPFYLPENHSWSEVLVWSGAAGQYVAEIVPLPVVVENITETISV